MDSELLSTFLNTLKEVNATLLELTKLTAHNQLAIKIIGSFVAIMGMGFISWFFTHMDSILIGVIK